MRALFQMFVRLSLLIVLAYLSLSSGSLATVGGWLLTGWVVFRAAPGCWSDLRRVWSLGKSISSEKFSFRRGLFSESKGL